MSVTVFQELRIRAQLDPVVRRKLAAYPLQFLADFDLSFDEKRQIVLPQFSWILEERLAAMPFPWTEDEYVVLQQLGIKVILNLTGYLTTRGLPAQGAIDYIRKLRPGSVETEEQEEVIYEYSSTNHCPAPVE